MGPQNSCSAATEPNARLATAGSVPIALRVCLGLLETVWQSVGSRASEACQTDCSIPGRDVPWIEHGLPWAGQQKVKSVLGVSGTAGPRYSPASFLKKPAVRGTRQEERFVSSTFF